MELLSFSDYEVRSSTGNPELPVMTHQIPDLFPEGNLNFLKSSVFENDGLEAHQLKAKPWQRKASRFSETRPPQRERMHPADLDDRLNEFQELVNNRIDIDASDQQFEPHSERAWNNLVLLE
jgi:hypothetical protein